MPEMTSQDPPAEQTTQQAQGQTTQQAQDQSTQQAQDQSTQSTSPIAQSNTQAFVVYVPPEGDNKAVQSCMRLGTFHADEQTTYNNVTAASTKFLELDAYSKDDGIALLTPGTITLIATEGVSMLSKSNSSSTTGMTYAVTADPKTNMVISAELLEQQYGTWVTQSYTRASEAAISTNFQTAFNLSANYEFSCGLAFANVLGVSYENVVGINVSQTVGMGIEIDGTSMTTKWLGDTFDYGEDSKKAMARMHMFGIIDKLPAYDSYERAEKIYVYVAQALAGAAMAASAAYAMAVAILAGHQQDKVKSALSAGEALGIACVAANGLVTAAGVVLGIIQIRAHNAAEASKANTRVDIAKDSVALHADADTTLFVGNKPKREDPLGGPPKIVEPGKNSIWIEKDVGIKTKAGDKAIANITKDSIELSFDTAKASIKLETTGLTLKFGTNKIEMTDNGIKITGPSPGVIDISATGIDIQGTALKFGGKVVKVEP